MADKDHGNQGPAGRSRKLNRIFPPAFFAAAFAYLYFLGALGQPSIHPYFDCIGIRDAGTTISTYLSGPNPVKTVVAQAMLHYEGPLQYVFLNAYCYAVGDLFALNPSTMQFPNTLLSVVAMVYAFLLGKRLLGVRFGYCVALAFGLAAWLGDTIRVPWYFNTLSCLLHFSTFYYFVGFAQEPGSTTYKIAAPVSLAAYMLTGMDWPAFFFSFGLFVVFGGRLRLIALNPFNVVPAMAALLQVSWPLYLFLKGRTDLIPGTMLLYPFLRYTDLAGNPDFAARVFDNVLMGWGLHLALAVAGLVVYALGRKRLAGSERSLRSFFDAMCVWFLGASYGIVSSSTSITYLYVLAMPTAILAGLALWRLRNSYVAALAVIMAVFQVYVATGKDFSFKASDDRRVLAAACFLVEQRPDLLSEAETAFLPRNMASCVGQYARGRNKRIIMPRDFPVELRKHSVGSDVTTLLDFVHAYNDHGEIRADWILLDSELFDSEVAARDFYLRISRDPNVKWIARFKDRTGHEIYLGVVEEGKCNSIHDAPELDTEALSSRYEAKYDRISFLKKNVEFVDHY